MSEEKIDINQNYEESLKLIAFILQDQDNPSALKFKSKTLFLRKFRYTFTGSEAAESIRQTFGLKERLEVLDIGQKLLDLGYFIFVIYSKNAVISIVSPGFKDDPTCLYNFVIFPTQSKSISIEQAIRTVLSSPIPQAIRAAHEQFMKDEEKDKEKITEADKTKDANKKSKRRKKN